MSMSDVIERLKKRIEARKWKITDDTSIPELIGMQYANNMNDWCLEIIDEELAKEPQECKWFKYDYRTIAPKNHDVENPYWRIPEDMNKLEFCPYCGGKIKVIE